MKTRPLVQRLNQNFTDKCYSESRVSSSHRMNHGWWIPPFDTDSGLSNYILHDWYSDMLTIKPFIPLNPSGLRFKTPWIMIHWGISRNQHSHRYLHRSNQKCNINHKLYLKCTTLYVKQNWNPFAALEAYFKYYQTGQKYLLAYILLQLIKTNAAIKYNWKHCLCFYFLQIWYKRFTIAKID